MLSEPEQRPVCADPLPRPLSEHCRPGRCLALTCCSYECSRGRCPSIPEQFRTPMSNYAYAGVFDGDDRAIVGPETVNGTGEVYLRADDLCFLTNEEARELGRALIEAADYAAALRDEMRERGGAAVPGGLVSRFEWTDPAWRDAKEQP